MKTLATMSMFTFTQNIIRWMALWSFFWAAVPSLRAQKCPLSYAATTTQLRLNDSLSIAYTEKGTGTTTLLMVHGLGGNLSHWSQNMDELSKSHRCIAIDLPGYGLSTSRSYSGESLSFYARTLVEFIAKKKLTNVVLIGHSMGGQTAIITVLQKSPAIKRLVLVAPAGLETFSEAEATLLRQFATPTFYKAQGETAIRAAFASNFTTLPPTAETLIKDRLQLRNCEGFDTYCQVVSQGVNGMLAHPVQAQLSQLTLPTLLIFGTDDKLIPNRILHKELTTLKVADIGKTQIPNVRLELIPNAGHLVMFEQPSSFNQLILNFLK